MKKNVKKKIVIKRGTRRFEAWIYAVINPQIEALKVEKYFLIEQNWTWQYHMMCLVSIQPLEKYIESIALPNFEDFLKANPKITRKMKKHDELVSTLSENCQIAFNYLVSSRAFQEKVISSLSRYEKEEPAGGYPGGAVPREDFKKLIAQYVINKIKELPDHYATSRFWSRFGDEILRFGIGEVFEGLDVSGEKLAKEDAGLLTALEDLRSELCNKYDIPAAPITHLGGSFATYQWEIEQGYLEKLKKLSR